VRSSKTRIDSDRAAVLKTAVFAFHHVGVTPAVEAGITDHVWELAELLETA
jgi:hypothetical protein